MPVLYVPSYLEYQIVPSLNNCQTTTPTISGQLSRCFDTAARSPAVYPELRENSRAEELKLNTTALRNLKTDGMVDFSSFGATTRVTSGAVRVVKDVDLECDALGALTAGLGEAGGETEYFAPGASLLTDCDFARRGGIFVIAGRQARIRDSQYIDNRCFLRSECGSNSSIDASQYKDRIQSDAKTLLIEAVAILH